MAAGRLLATIAILALCLVAACGGKDAQHEEVTDLSTPQGAVNAFLAAAQAKDAKALSQVFSRKCEREFKPLADGTVGMKMLTELADMFKDASITDMKRQGDKAQFDVKLPNHPRGKETLNLVKEGDVWKIHGF